MWHNMLFPSDSTKEPDFISVYVPDWPETLIFLDVNQGYTYILGTDYPGEAKKSMLRQAMYWIKRRGGLGLHAGLEDPPRHRDRTASSATSASSSSGSPAPGRRRSRSTTTASRSPRRRSSSRTTSS